MISEETLLPAKKNTVILIEQTRTQSQEIMDFKTKDKWKEVISFDTQLNLDEDKRFLCLRKIEV